jgi:hypothetical protein
MAFSFRAKIYKVGINPCVKVPRKVTNSMKPVKGYIPIKGKIGNHSFKQTLVPVKDEPYRLFVNGPMLKGANIALGEIAHFSIEQNFTTRKKEYPMPKFFKTALEKQNLFSDFKKLSPSRQKDILKYINSLKTEESRQRNIDKVIVQLTNKNTNTRIP